MNEAYNNLLTRRSIRKYRPEQISRAELDAVLEAGKCAPSGRNMQSAIMIVVQDPETVAPLSKPRVSSSIAFGWSPAAP